MSVSILDLQAGWRFFHRKSVQPLSINKAPDDEGDAIFSVRILVSSRSRLLHSTLTLLKEVYVEVYFLRAPRKVSLPQQPVSTGCLCGTATAQPSRESSSSHRSDQRQSAAHPGRKLQLLVPPFSSVLTKSQHCSQQLLELLHSTPQDDASQRATLRCNLYLLHHHRSQKMHVYSSLSTHCVACTFLSSPLIDKS